MSAFLSLKWWRMRFSGGSAISTAQIPSQRRRRCKASPTARRAAIALQLPPFSYRRSDKSGLLFFTLSAVESGGGSVLFVVRCVVVCGVLSVLRGG